MKVALLTSGSFGYEIFGDIIEDIQISVIATDKESSEIINLAEQNEIPLYVGNPREGKLLDFFNQNIGSIDIIFSVNYLFLLDNDLIAYPDGYCLNIHGSLLPKYRGRTPHVWAIINGEEFAGITVHIIDEGCDTGPIVMQKKIKILPDMTGGELLSKYKDHYPKLILDTLKQVERNSLSVRQQDDSKATYFGKRTPDDGQINWNWQKERIKNWVRAQADPYPGAFSYIDNTKITIDRIEYTDMGFSYDMPNGLIVSADPYPFVKVPNGVVAITDIRQDISEFEIVEKVLSG